MTDQELKLEQWLNSYKERIFRYNEPQRIAHRKEIENYLIQVGHHFNLN